jgi:hypothetical protein
VVEGEVPGTRVNDEIGSGRTVRIEKFRGQDAARK